MSTTSTRHPRHNLAGANSFAPDPPAAHNSSKQPVNDSENVLPAALPTPRARKPSNAIAPAPAAARGNNTKAVIVSPQKAAAGALITQPTPTGNSLDHVLIATSPSTPTRSDKKRKAASHGKGGGGECYDENTVRVLVTAMAKVGYGNRNNQQKSLKTVFEAAVRIAADDYSVTRSAEGWQKKFMRMRKEYSNYITKLIQSGRDGDDEDLYNAPRFFKLVNELERDKARHDPPAKISTVELANGTDYGSHMTNSRKRVKRERAMTLEEADARNERRQNELLGELRANNNHRAEFNKIFGKLIEKF